MSVPYNLVFRNSSLPNLPIVPNLPNFLANLPKLLHPAKITKTKFKYNNV